MLMYSLVYRANKANLAVSVDNKSLAYYQMGIAICAIEDYFKHDNILLEGVSVIV